MDFVVAKSNYFLESDAVLVVAWRTAVAVAVVVVAAAAASGSERFGRVRIRWWQSDRPPASSTLKR